MGIRKKLFFGFVIIGFILFLSGVISVLQLTQIGKSITGILTENMTSIEISRHLNEEAQRQGRMVSQLVISQKKNQRVMAHFSDQRFMKLIDSAASNITATKEHEVIDSLRSSYLLFRSNSLALDSLFALSYINKAYWYNHLYEPSFFRFLNTIDRLGQINQAAIYENSILLEKNFYRMIMPPIIAIIVGMVLIVLFYYFINLYLITPMLAIRKGIKMYLENKVTYNVKVDTKDEMGELNQEVRQLTALSKKKESADGFPVFNPISKPSI